MQNISITEKINNTCLLFDIINNEKETYTQRCNFVSNNKINNIKEISIVLEKAHDHYNKILELINGFLTLKYDIELFNKTYILLPNFTKRSTSTPIFDSIKEHEKNYNKCILLMLKIDEMLYSFSTLCE